MNNWIKKTISELKSQTKKIFRKMPSFSETETSAWTSCCEGPILKSDLFSKGNLGVCPKCNKHHRLNAKQRFDITFLGEDNYNILEIPIDKTLDDPIQFADGTYSYISKLKAARKKGYDCAIQFAVGKLNGIEVTVAAMTFDHLGASVSVHENRAIIYGVTHAIKNKNPLIIFACGGGQRLQENLHSLNCMVSTTQIITEYKKLIPPLPYILFYTDPCLGGITASFASPSLAHFAFAEIGATVGFSGRAVISATTKEVLNAEFQRSSEIKKNGWIDDEIHRKNITRTITNLLTILLKKNELKTFDEESNEDREVAKKTTATA